MSRDVRIQKRREQRDVLAERFEAAGLIRCAKPRPPGYQHPYSSQAEYHEHLILQGRDPLIIEYWVEEF